MLRRCHLLLRHERHTIQSVEVRILRPDVSAVHTCGRQNDAVSHGKICLQAQVGGKESNSLGEVDRLSLPHERDGGERRGLASVTLRPHLGATGSRCSMWTVNPIS